MRLDHLHILCRRLDPAIVFLTEAFGATLVKRRPMGAVPAPGAELTVGGLLVYLKEVGDGWVTPDPAAKVYGYSHLGFVVDDMEKTLASLTARPDTRLAVEPFLSGKRLCAFVAGPDNLYVEVMQDT